MSALVHLIPEPVLGIEKRVGENSQFEQLERVNHSKKIFLTGFMTAIGRFSLIYFHLFAIPDQK